MTPGPSSAGDGEPQLVIVVGAPRSGTTWLQRMLGGHPAIATAQETDVLTDYALAWHKAWASQLRGSPAEWEAHRHAGLPAVLTSEEFTELLRSAVSTVYRKILELKPGAVVVLDKSPVYAQHLPFITSLFPQAKVLNIIRDGRDVVASLTRAARTWASWAPRMVETAAIGWRDNVRLARAAGLGAQRYMEVRYEALLRDPSAGLRACLLFCEIEVSVAQCEAIASRCELKKMVPGGPEGDPILWSGEVARAIEGAPSEPSGFFGAGGSGSWRQAWSPYQRWAFDHLAGELLVELGYEHDRSWARVGSPVVAPYAVRLSSSFAVRWAARAFPQARDAARSLL